MCQLSKVIRQKAPKTLLNSILLTTVEKMWSGVVRERGLRIEINSKPKNLS